MTFPQNRMPFAICRPTARCVAIAGYVREGRRLVASGTAQVSRAPAHIRDGGPPWTEDYVPAKPQRRNRVAQDCRVIDG